MNRWLFGISALCIVAAHFGPSSLELLEPFATRGAHATALDSGARMLTAAKELLASLDGADETEYVFALGGKEHEDWHFIPRSRRGVALRKMTETQREKTRALLRAGLSELGFKKAEDVRYLEEVLHSIETPNPNRGFVRDPLLYYVSFFNKPTADGRWGWRYEGHHLSLNFVLDGDRVISHTPGMFGSNPAVVTSGPRKGLQVLDKVENLARDLVASMGTAQRKACLGEEVPREVPSTQKARYDGPLPRGVAGESLSIAQKETLRSVINAYLEKFPPDLAQAVWERVRGGGGLDSVHVAWRGSLTRFEPHSYLIHGPHFVINYSNMQGGGKHVHSSFRSLENDFQ